MTDWIDALPNEIPLIGDTLPEAPEYTPPEYETGTRYYRLTWYHIPFEYKSGVSIKLPGLVFKGGYQEIKNTCHQHASSKTIDVFIGSKEDYKTGETHYFSYKFGNYKRANDKIVDGELHNKAGNQFMELAWPALKAMPLADRQKLQKTGNKVLTMMKKSGSMESITLKEAGTFVYAKVVDEAVDKKNEWGKFDPKMKIVSIQLFPDEESWKADQEATFGGSTSQTNEEVDYIDIVPDDWKSSDDLIRDFKKYFLDYHKDGKALESLGLQPSQRLAEVVAGWLEVDAPPPLWPDEVKQYLP